jgi:hypothetical protein
MTIDHEVRVWFPVLPWGFFLEGEDCHGDHGLDSLAELRLRPLLVLHTHISPSTKSGQRNCAIMASQPQESVTLQTQPGRETTKSIRDMWWHWKKNSIRDLGHVLTGMLMKVQALCNLTSCRSIYSCLHFCWPCCLHFQCSQESTLKMEAETSFGSSVPITYTAPYPRILAFSDKLLNAVQRKERQILLSECSRYEWWTLGRSVGKHFGKTCFFEESSPTSCEKQL